MHAIGICHYVMAALVPELAVRLIKEEKVCDESARQILQESRRFGTLRDPTFGTHHNVLPPTRTIYIGITRTLR
jgi:hypothetical protein